jgi:hypothetical protein
MSRTTAFGEGQGRLGLEEILQIFERDEAQHVRLGPSSDNELRTLEKHLKRPLPASFRRFLNRLGGGLYYDGHEIFGTHRVVIHDIELVPDMLSVRSRLGREGIELPEGLIPVHRARGLIHFMDLKKPGDAVLSLPWSEPYPDLPSFLAAVVLKKGEPVS